jgi:hypothetical protein
MSPPVVIPLTPIPVGHTDPMALRLAPGDWDISLEYMSPTGLSVSAAGRRWSMPPYTDRPGTAFLVGSTHADGSPIQVTLQAGDPSIMTGPILASLTSALIATRHPADRTLVPLRQACGRYVDWYRLGGRIVPAAR